MYVPKVRLGKEVEIIGYTRYTVCITRIILVDKDNYKDNIR